jgi:hypothetical protein
MKVLSGIIIFIIVLFFYLHLQYQLKTSSDLEIYTIEYPSKDRLEELCDIRQPMTFQYNINDEVLNRQYIVDNYSAFDVQIRDSKDTDNYSIPLAISVANKAFYSDKAQQYYSENNQNFLEETGLIKRLQNHDTLLRPLMVSNCYYDLMYGSNDTTTPFRYELNYRNYFFVKNGSIQLKLCPPKYGKHLHCVKDYNNLEFRSKINPWNVAQEYLPDFNKVKCLDVTITQGTIIFIPAYWWYSIKFNNDSEVISMKYRTYMNNLAITPHTILAFLQMQNNKNKITDNLATLDVTSTNDNKTATPTEDTATPAEGTAMPTEGKVIPAAESTTMPTDGNTIPVAITGTNTDDKQN